MLKLLFILFFVSILNFACSTDTGNPGIENHSGQGNDGNIDPITQSVMGLVADATCIKTFSCFDGVVKSECVDSVFKHGPMVPRVGFVNKDFENMLAIAEAEAKQEIKFELDAVKLCLSDITTLTCDDPGVEKAFKEGEGNPFNQIEEMIPDSCQSIEKTED